TAPPAPRPGSDRGGWASRPPAPLPGSPGSPRCAAASRSAPPGGPAAGAAGGRGGTPTPSAGASAPATPAGRLPRGGSLRTARPGGERGRPVAAPPAPAHDAAFAPASREYWAGPPRVAAARRFAAASPDAWPHSWAGLGRSPPRPL